MADLLAMLLGDPALARRFLAADEDGRMAVVTEAFDYLETIQMLPRLVVLQQIAEDPEGAVAETGRRLLAEGLSPGQVLSQLTIVQAHLLTAALEGETVENLPDLLARLPLPAADDIEEALLDIASEHVIIDGDTLLEQAAARLGVEADDVLVGQLLERVEEALVIAPFGPLVWLWGDRTVSVAALARGMVLTHVLTEEEVDDDHLHVGFDLAVLGCLDPVLADGTAVEPAEVGDEEMVWDLPEGWLTRYGPGTCLAVTVGADGKVSVEALDHPPPADPALVTLLAEVYEEETQETGGPEDGLTLLVALRARDPQAFSTPQAPLQVLCEQAGLLRRGTRVADDPRAWRRERRMSRIATILDRADDDQELQRAASGVLAVCDRLLSGEDVEAAKLRTALDRLTDPDVLELVEDVLTETDPGAADEPTLAELLLPHARRPRQHAAVRYLAALQAEADGQTLAAEQHLELAYEADPGFAPSTDRLAWYASDRGDAARAARLWRRLPPTAATAADLAEVEAQLGAGDGGKSVRRNDPCWCGSGRKFKRCHLGVAAPRPLPDRVGWLCRKAVAYVERRRAATAETVVGVLMARTGGNLEAAQAVLDDPVVMDLVLVEGGWFDAFYQDRSVLLPDDEALLAATWLTIPRTVYEVAAVRPGQGLSLTDLRTGDVVEVRERTFSRQAAEGDLVCARAVPDGETAQLIGAVIPVRPGRESELLDILDRADPYEIASWVGAREQPPRLVNRENEPLVAVTTVVTVADPAATRRHLDEAYDADEQPGAWIEHQELDADQSLIRAHLRMDGEQVTVTTNSHERIDRILDRLATVTDIRIESDERTPISTAADLTALANGLGSGPNDGPAEPLPPEVMAQIQASIEYHWLDEHVPALGGLTPRQAAADPTRREQLERLLRSFEALPVPEGGLGMRPARLRELLGL